MESSTQPIKSQQIYLQPVSPTAFYPQEDQMSLYDLWKILVARKWIILFVTMAAFSVASVYVWFAAPAFEAEVLFLPPDSGDIYPLSKIYENSGTQGTQGIQGIQGTQGVNVNTVYLLFKRNLESRTLQRTFFHQSGIDAVFRERSGDTITDDALFVQFSQENISVETNRTDSDFLALVFSWHDAVQAAEFANAYVRHVMEFTVSQLVGDARKLISSRIADVENNIAKLRRMAYQYQLDRITVLKEALMIAKAIELVEMTPETLGNNNPPDITVAGLYMRGSRLLSAELEALKSRESVDAFVPGLRDLQKEQEQLKEIQLDPAHIRVARLDQPAYPPLSPVKPKRKLVLAMGLVLGLLLGVFTVFFVNFLEKQRVAEQ